MSQVSRVAARKYRPYILGALSGLLLVLSVAFAGQYFGASTTYPRSAAWIERAAGVDVSRFEYFTTKEGKYGPDSLPNWQLLFVVGIAAGAFLASRATGTFRHEKIPPMWAERFGSSSRRRAAFAVLGGIMAMVGVRLAGGCPSGHGLSGVSQLAASGFLAMVFFFAGGIATAKLIYRRN